MDTKKFQISDSITCGILLALSGGCMDAYSFLHRGRVFANAQTGNMLLFGVRLVNDGLTSALKYLYPILFFIGGIVIADVINIKKESMRTHWRQISVALEAIILVIVAFLPGTVDSLANMMTSFACGIQLESFRVINDNSVATTMCIGNLRNGMFNLNRYINTKDTGYLKKVFLYFGIIAAFIIGAIVESLLVNSIGGYAILLSPTLLAIVLILLFFESKNEDGNTPC